MWFRGRMEATAAPDHIEYLDSSARTPAGVDYKRKLTSALDLRAGQTVLDIGCGPGTDLGTMADVVAPGGSADDSAFGLPSRVGSVIGIDSDPRMPAEARRRFGDRPEVTVWSGDAHNMPVADASIDRARTDRVLQHVTDPARVIAEARRVLRPGGRLAMAEPDWDTLAVAGEDVAGSRAWARFVASCVRNATMGRQLARLSAGAGLTVRSVEAVAVLFQDFDSAEQVLGLRRTTARAVLAGALASESWLERLTEGPFLAGFTLFLVVAEKVGGER
jgi:ubiquinone/menaquinone biosynthesis C-methylase UbiE